MKLICLTLLVLLAAGCQEKKENADTETKTDTAVKVQDPHLIRENPEVSESLAKMAPHSREEMLALLPATLMGAAKENEDANNSIGVTTSTADYRINDSTKLELIIIDCAGPAGVGVYNVQYAGMLGFNEEDEEEYTKTVDFGGGKAFENCSKTRMDCSLTWFVGRYLVSLGGNVTAARLKEVASELKF